MTESSAILEVCLALRARRVARRVSRFYDKVLLPLGLDISRFNVLCAIGARAPAPLTDVAAILDLDPSTLSRLLKTLRASGLVEAEGGRGRGGLTLSLSERGEGLVDDAAGAWRQAQGQLSASLGEAQMSRTVEAMERLEQAT